MNMKRIVLAVVLTMMLAVCIKAQKTDVTYKVRGEVVDSLTLKGESRNVSSCLGKRKQITSSLHNLIIPIADLYSQFLLLIDFSIPC